MQEVLMELRSCITQLLIKVSCNELKIDGMISTLTTLHVTVSRKYKKIHSYEPMWMTRKIGQGKKRQTSDGGPRKTRERQSNFFYGIRFGRGFWRGEFPCKCQRLSYCMSDGGNKISFFPDVSADLMLTRAEFSPVKKQLHQAGTKFSLVHPATLQFFINGSKHEFKSPEEASAFLARHILPAALFPMFFFYGLNIPVNTFTVFKLDSDHA